MTRLADRLHNLDERVLGCPVPDNRPLTERMLRPRPAVWSSRGRLLGGLIVLGFFGLAWWSPGLPVAALAASGLLAVAFALVAAEERERARRFHGEE